MSTQSLQPGMRLGKPVIGNDGRELLHKGRELRESYITTLQRMEIPSVYVTNDMAPDVEPIDVVSDQTRRELTAGMRQAMLEIRKVISASARTGQRRFASSSFDASPLKAGVYGVISDLLRNPAALVNLQEIRTAGEYQLGHAVNVCVMSVLTGLSLGYDEKRLQDLGMGALLHDVGKVAVAQDLLQREDALTPAESEAVSRHPRLGWEILTKQPEISYVSATVALQHHERWVGGGYPEGRKQEEIHEYARICAVANRYDALVTERPGRRGHHPLRALKIMSELTADHFDPQVLELFMECLAVYPIGSLLELSGGYQAIVVAVERGKNLRPKVRVVRDPSGSTLTKSVEIDLANHPNIQILRTLQEDAS